MSGDEDIFIITTYDYEENLTKIKKAFEYFESKNYLNVNVKPNEVFDDSKAFKALFFIFETTRYAYYRDVPKSEQIFIEKQFHNLLGPLIEYASRTCNELKYSDFNEDSDTTNARKALILGKSQPFLNFLVPYSVVFRTELFQKGGVKGLLRLLNDDNYFNSFSSQPFYETITMNLNWISKNADSYKHEWLELDAVDTLLKTANRYPKVKLYASFALTNIMNDKQIETLPDIHVIIEEIVSLLDLASDMFLNSLNPIEREDNQFFEEDETQQEQTHPVYYIHHPTSDIRLSLTGILLPLYRLSVGNTIKYDMFEKYKAKNKIRTIILRGNIIERKYALRLLAQLCFDPRVKNAVFEDQELKDFIAKFGEEDHGMLKSIKRLCKQILWTSEQVNERSLKTTEKKIANQIMISYNSGSRDLCLKIKNELEKANFKVWIDVNEIHGSSLEAMARAVESSEIILMCVTEKYRQSVNCQAEAQYAFKLKKKIIPLIMQKGYEHVDGWLGIILGDKIFINFTKFSVEEGAKRLLNEINLHLKNSVEVKGDANNADFPIKVNSSQTLSSQPKEGSIKKWTEAQVTQWFKDNNLNMSILQMLSPCDGELLHQLYILQHDAPEFFYQSISKNTTIDLRTILVFTINLKKLFD